MTPSRALTRHTFGAWLIKGRRSATPIEQLLRTDFHDLTSRCVRQTYRLDLVESGQPVLFWLSGEDALLPAGIYAQGTTTGPAEPQDAAAEQLPPRSRMSDLPVRLERMDPPVHRSELLRHPTLCRIEVIRMAAGSNPSFLTADQLAELRAGWPQVT